MYYDIMSIFEVTVLKEQEEEKELFTFFGYFRF